MPGVGLHNKVVRAEKELGTYTIVTDYNIDSSAKSIADEAGIYSVTDVDLIVTRCKGEEVDGGNPAQRPTQQICERLGIPCIRTKGRFEILTDKCRFKDFCISNNVDVILDYTDKDIIEDNVEYPIFIKPTDSDYFTSSRRRDVI